MFFNQLQQAPSLFLRGTNVAHPHKHISKSKRPDAHPLPLIKRLSHPKQKKTASLAGWSNPREPKKEASFAD
ncbi:unnamed protein product [Pylaiella littoralis]